MIIMHFKTRMANEVASSSLLGRKRSVVQKKNSEQQCTHPVNSGCRRAQAPIDLPEQVLVMIVLRMRNVTPRNVTTAGADARSLYADVMRGIGSA